MPELRQGQEIQITVSECIQWWEGFTLITDLELWDALENGRKACVSEMPLSCHFLQGKLMSVATKTPGL